MLFAGSRSVRIVKNCDLGLKNAAFGTAASVSISKPSVTVFHHYGPPIRQMTDMYFMVVRYLSEKKSMLAQSIRREVKPA